MFTLGVYLAQTDLLDMVKKPVLYKLSLVRLLVIPVVSVLLLALLPKSMQGMKLALLLVAACPVGSNVAVYAQLHDADYPYAVETVIVSTILSLLTLPVISWLSEIVWTLSPG
jgi:predicted permease